MKRSNRAVILLAAFTLLSVGGDVLACPDIAYAHHGQEHHIRRRYEFSDSRLFGPGNLGSWEHHDGCRRYVYHDGSCAKGWTIIGGETFYFDEEGNALTDSFLSNEGKLRYLKDDGMMLRNKEAAFDGITYIIDGEFIFNVNGEEHLCKAGDSLHFAKNMTHGCKCIKKGRLLDTFTPEREDFLNN